MKKIYMYLLPIFLFFIILQFSASGEEQHLTFTVIIIPGYDVPDYLNNSSYIKIRNPLKNEGYTIDDYHPDINKNISFDNCISRNCVQEIKKIFPDKIVIVISITAAEVKIGHKQLSRYLMEDITEIRYTIYVLTTDPLKDKYELTFKKTFLDSTKLLNEAGQIGLKIGEHYSGKRMN